MQVLLQNRGTTPLPIGTPDAGGVENLLPPGIEIAIARDDIATLIFGEQPEPAGRNKLDALAVDPASPLAVEYGTDIDQWKGRGDDTAETATMHVVLFVKNVGADPVTLTTTEGVIELLKDEGTVVETLAGLKLEGALPPPPVPTTVQITSFTAEFDSMATAADTTLLDAGDTVTLAAVAGTPEAMALVDGHTGAIFDLTASTFRILGLDLSGVDVTDLAATATPHVVVDLTGTITAFTATSPTTATMDAEDEGMLMPGAVITLEALAGDPAAVAIISGASATVLSVAPVTLNIDLSAVDVTGLTADFTVR